MVMCSAALRASEAELAIQQLTEHLQDCRGELAQALAKAAAAAKKASEQQAALENDAARVQADFAFHRDQAAAEAGKKENAFNKLRDQLQTALAQGCTLQAELLEVHERIKQGQRTAADEVMLLEKSLQEKLCLVEERAALASRDLHKADADREALSQALAASEASAAKQQEAAEKRIHALEERDVHLCGQLAAAQDAIEEVRAGRRDDHAAAEAQLERACMEADALRNEQLALEYAAKAGLCKRLEEVQVEAASERSSLETTIEGLRLELAALQAGATYDSLPARIWSTGCAPTVVTINVSLAQPCLAIEQTDKNNFSAGCTCRSLLILIAPIYLR